MRAARDLQIPSIKHDGLPEGDLQRGDMCLKGEIAGWDLEHSGKIIDSSFPTISLKNALCLSQGWVTSVSTPGPWHGVRSSQGSVGPFCGQCLGQVRVNLGAGRKWGRIPFSDSHVLYLIVQNLVKLPASSWWPWHIRNNSVPGGKTVSRRVKTDQNRSNSDISINCMLLG